MKLISKEEAILLGQVWYFTGIECYNHHIDKRYVKTNVCYQCKRDYNKKNNLIHNDIYKEMCKRSYIKNKEIINERNKKWAIENKEKSNAIKKKWKENHREQHLAQARKYIKEKRKNNFYRISRNLSKAIWQNLGGKKGGVTWLKYVDFSFEELTEHLQSKFTNNINWNNYGSYWHVDHIRPLSWFNLEIEFKQAWCLSNLQPLEAEKNLSKNNRYEG